MSTRHPVPALPTGPGPRRLPPTDDPYRLLAAWCARIHIRLLREAEAATPPPDAQPRGSPMRARERLQITSVARGSGAEVLRSGSTARTEPVAVELKPL